VGCECNMARSSPVELPFMPSNVHVDKAGQGGDDGGLATAGLEGLMAWTPTYLTPVDIAHMAMAATPFLAAVSYACAAQLRVAKFLLLAPSGGEFTQNERALHRAQRQSAAIRVTCVAAENYSVAIDATGQLLIWGRPGWMAALADTHKDAPPPLPVQVVGSSARHCHSKLTSLAASRHAVFALSSEGQVLFAEAYHESSDQMSNIKMCPLPELEKIKITQVSTALARLLQ